MQIDESEEHILNASDSIRETFEPGSNATVERDRHSEKQEYGRSLSEQGRKSDESEAHLANA
jgi:hypothetical protein